VMSDIVCLEDELFIFLARLLNECLSAALCGVFWFTIDAKGFFTLSSTFTALPFTLCNGGTEGFLVEDFCFLLLTSWCSTATEGVR